MAQFEFVAWLVRWLLDQENFGFDWDMGNSSKSIQKHKIEIEQAEQIFRNKDLLIPLGIQTQPQTNEPRFGALGMDRTGQTLSVCFTIREGKIRIISVRAMSRMERRKYETLRKK